MMPKNKKGAMELGGLYSFVLLLVLVGMIIGDFVSAADETKVGVLVLDKFAATSGLTDTAELAINNSRDAITPIASTWLPLIFAGGLILLLKQMSNRSSTSNNFGYCYLKFRKKPEISSLDSID